MTLDELFQHCEDWTLMADKADDFPHAVVVGEDGTINWLALALGNTTACLAAVHESIRKYDGVCAAWIAETWTCALTAEEIVRRYGLEARRDFSRLPAEVRGEAVVIYAQDRQGNERFKEWHIHGEAPARSYELVREGLEGVSHMTFRPLFPKVRCP